MFKKLEMTVLEVAVTNLCVIFAYIVIGKVAYEVGREIGKRSIKQENKRETEGNGSSKPKEEPA
jgi:predicted hydrocarbon binding protein